MKHPANIKDRVGQQVFIVGCDGDLETGDIDVFETIDELNKHLSSLSPISETNITVVHGILTSAKCIPEKIGRGVYLIVIDRGDPDTGAIFEITSGEQDKLIEVIEEALSELDSNSFSEVTIDEIFVLYGYEMSMCYAVDPKEVDIRLIWVSEKIADVANEMREKLLNVEV